MKKILKKKQKEKLEEIMLVSFGIVFFYGVPLLCYSMGFQYQSVECLNALFWGILYGSGVVCFAGLLLDKIKKEVNEKYESRV